MQYRSIHSCLILLGIIAIVGVGCASHNAQPAVFHYKNLMEQQKARAPLEENALKNLPDMTAADYERLGDNYLRMGNLNMAFIQYEKALRLDPTQTILKYKMGILFVKKGLPQDAMLVFQEIQKSDAQYALAYEGMGQAFLKVNNVVEAEKNFRQSLTFNPQLWQSHNFLGMIYHRQKQFDKAITEYRAAIAIKPDQGVLFNNLGLAHFFKGEYESALQAFHDGLQTGIAQNKLYNNMGLGYGKLGRYQEALEAFKKGSDEIKAWNNLGVIYLAAGKYQEAIAAFEKAIALSPTFHAKANANLKVAQQALAKMAQVSTPPAQMTTSAALRSQPEQSAPVLPSPLPQEPEDREETYYTVQVHVFRTKAKADRVVAQYLKQGHPAFSAPAEGPEGQPWWQIFVGRFKSEAEAETFGQEFSQREGLSEFLVVLRSGAGV